MDPVINITSASTNSDFQDGILLPGAVDDDISSPSESFSSVQLEYEDIVELEDGQINDLKHKRRSSKAAVVTRKRASSSLLENRLEINARNKLPMFNDPSGRVNDVMYNNLSLLIPGQLPGAF